MSIASTPKVFKQSLIDWSVSLDGKNIGHITKEYLKGNSGPYTFRVKAFGYVDSKTPGYTLRVSKLDYTWNVIRTFKEAKQLIVDYAKD